MSDGPSDSQAGASTTTTAALFDFDEQVELLANAAFAEGLPYFIRVGGRALSGRVGSDRRLPRVDTPAESSYEVFVGDEALALMEGTQA